MSTETFDPITAGVFLKAIVQAEIKPACELLAGYQTALMVILKKLDEAGVLPASEAKVAIDEAHALLTEENKKSGQGLVLRQLSEGLAPRQACH